MPGPTTGLNEAALTTDVTTGRKSGETVKVTPIVCVDVFANTPVVATTTWPLYVPTVMPVGLTPTLTVKGVVPPKVLAVSHGTLNETETGNWVPVLVI